MCEAIQKIARERRTNGTREKIDRHMLVLQIRQGGTEKRHPDEQGLVELGTPRNRLAEYITKSDVDCRRPYSLPLHTAGLRGER